MSCWLVFLNLYTVLNN